MKIKNRIACACVLAVSWASPAAAQPFGLSLAQTNPGTTTSVTADPGTYTVMFENLLPTRSYTISVSHHAVDIPPLPVTAIPWIKGTASPPELAIPEECIRLQAAAAALARNLEEPKVPDLADALRAALDAGCSDTSVVDTARALLDRTAQSALVTVLPGEVATITIQRQEIDKDHKAAQWTLTISTGGKGEWLISYGFTFGRSYDDHFFSQAAGNNTFKVTEETDVWRATFIPSIYFSWQSRSADRGTWGFSPTVGIGATKDAPAFMVGVSALYNRNLGFVAGLAMTQQQKLNGQYHADQIINENLTEDQLHQKVWRPSFVVGATLRFASNPFSSGNAAANAGDKSAGKTGGDAAAAGTPAGTPQAGKPGNTTRPEKPASSAEASVASALSFSSKGYRIIFDESGDLTADGAKARDDVLKAVPQATDVFVLSHGWWNNPATADCSYQQLVDGLRSRVPKELGASFKPLIVGVFWPSAVFPQETGECEPQIKTPQGPEALVQGSFDAEVSAWAAAAFPAASKRPAFEAERARVVQLLSNERRGEKLTRPQTLELARLLDGWRRAAPGADAMTSDGPAAELFADQPAAIVDQWLAEVNKSGPAEAFTLTKIVNFANAFTFWTMKTRAGVVGSRGVYDLVQAIRAQGGPKIRIHLIGHSFGGRVLSAAIAGRAGAPLNQVDSLIILEGAFSHFAFSTKEQIAGFGFSGDGGGVFERVVTSFSTASPAIRGRLVATFSSQDQPNQVLYPAATKLRGSDREANRLLRYGSIGADGVQGPQAAAVRLDTIGSALQTALSGPGRIYNVDASNVIRGHSDLIHDQVFDLIWTAVMPRNQ
jgi:hypothetical protein